MRCRRSVRSAARRPSVGEAHAAIRLVRDQPLSASRRTIPLTEAGEMSRRCGDLVRRRRLRAALEVVDRLEVVLDRAAERLRDGRRARASRRLQLRAATPRTMQDRHGGAVAHLVRDAAAQEILHALVAVRAHGDEVAPLALGRGGDLGAGVAAGEHALGVDARGLELVAPRSM